MAEKSWKLSRRTLLRGTGAALALPWLESMGSAFAAPSGTAAGGPPLRMAFIMSPNGMNMPDWTPAKDGTDFELPYLLEPFNPVKSKLTVLSGLTHDKARANGDGPGDHARSSGTFLTGVQCRKTSGKDIQAGVSVDQLAAERSRGRTPLDSLELGCEAGQQAGNCDSGYSCAYSSNISWRTPSTPMGKEINPRLVFERLFGSAEDLANRQQAQQRARLRASLLDQVRDEAKSLQGRVSGTDSRKIDEYLDTVRSIEQRIQAAENRKQTQAPEGASAPAGVPRDYAEHLRLMYDLMAMAFQTDSTRIITFMVANEGSNRTYPMLDVKEGHHSISHHGKDPTKIEHIRRINRFHTEALAEFLKKLDGIREGDRTLLDQSMIVFGSAIGDGDRHNHDDLPIILAGRGGGSIRSGRHLKYPVNTPLCNLYLSMLDRFGTPVDNFGDGNGRIENLG